MISQKQMECRNVVDPVIVVRAVPEQLHELFFNLISNAVHFSSEKGAIVISAEQDDTTVMISVQDAGVGLAPADLEHVFDEFFKADESRHDIGTPGLGLSICKRIVQNHHGRIWAESPGIGKGTTIKFTINEQRSDNQDNEKESK
jgi:signal transduction histidine kinase